MNTRKLYCVEWTQYSIRPKRSAICNSLSMGPPKSWTQTVSQSLPNFLQGSLGDRPTDRPTDHTTRSFTIVGIYLCSTAIKSNNNNCSISRLLDCFPCLYRRPEQGSRRQETSLHQRYGIACSSLCSLEVSPVNARLTSLSYVHQYIFFSVTYALVIVTPPTKFFRIILHINRPPPA